MKAFHVTRAELTEVLGILNNKWDDNIDMEVRSSGYSYLNVRLSAKSYDKPGWRRSADHMYWDGKVHKGHRMKWACWHVWGDFFDILFAVAPDAICRSRGMKITKNEGNWEDFDIGSMMYPVQMSEVCECENN